MNITRLKKYMLTAFLVVTSAQTKSLLSMDLDDEADMQDIDVEVPQVNTKPATPVTPVKKELQKPKIKLTGINNQTSHKLNIILGGDTFTIAPKKTEMFDIAFNLSPTTPALKIPNATVRAYKSSGPIRIRLGDESSESNIKKPTKGDLFLISVPFYQVNQAYGTEWANARIVVEEPSVGDIGKRSPVILASWDNEGKNMRLSEGKQHDLKINLTIVEKPTYTKDAEGKQVETTYVDLETDALEVEVDEIE